MTTAENLLLRVLDEKITRMETAWKKDSATLHESLSRTDREVGVLTRCLEGWSHADIEGLFTRINEHERLLTPPAGRFDAMAAAGQDEVKKRVLEEHYRDLRSAWPPNQVRASGTPEGVDRSLDNVVESCKQWMRDEPIPNDVRRQIEWAIRRAHKLGVDSVPETKGG